MKPYNPLEKENLGKSVASSLIQQATVPLGSISRFQGAGVYAIYYTGKFEAYAPLGEANSAPDGLNLPIYIGKAIPTGGRKGAVDPEISARGTSLFFRLEEHRKSIEQATNLDIGDFWCRFLVVDDIWIPLGESLLIQRFRPIWNSVVDGFGNHDPGSGRHAGKRPSWDTLHPGRVWADKCAPSKFTEAEIRDKISQHWQIRDEYNTLE
ncbi:Eco29kI family restriction endonuclease [Luteolibacter ambystomatis]|uniref:Eco29kI family restriction endonuclease n=1 Tax=Luteolibacter ambystomatis TaxID=2824561 RepID=A0A975IZX4_9BACT|nr:Eco29kI family restriction endonuclease [Luteolibacter ambystomatis]QUE50640.1 Eco29kI family restriction endonuclease [Luteolibacter ambystomatis]